MNRASLLANIPVVLKYLKREHAEDAAGQATLFGIEDEAPLQLIELPELSLAQRLDDERRLLGGFFSGHPVTAFTKHLHWRTHTCSQRHEIEQAGTSARIVIAGLVRRFESWGRSSVLEVEDETGPLELRVFGREQERYQWILKRDMILALKLTPRYDADRTSIVVQEAKKVGEFKAEKPAKYKAKRR